MRIDLKYTALYLIAAAIVFALIVTVGRACADEPDPVYKEAYDLAVSKSKPLIVFVAVDIREVKGCVSVALDDFYGATPRVIVGVPGKIGAVLPVTATDAEILAAVKGEGLAAPKGGQPTGRPFGQSSVAATADDSRASSVEEPIPPHLTIFADMERYTSARMTQRSFRVQSGMINAVPRTVLANKWLVPGGLDGVRGWKSTLYRSRDRNAPVVLAPVEPGVFGTAITYQRPYRNDVDFADILRNDAGKIFEIRVAEKRDGKWDRYVAYRNKAAQPVGYVVLRSKDCQSCHEKAGSAEYAGAAIPGSDTIFSDEIEPVETGNTTNGDFGSSLGGRFRRR
jgi:hypothetical protein